MSFALHSQGSQRASPRRRDCIVAAATQLFATTRYDAVQIDDVARAAGVAKPTLYRYFATKEDLFLEAVDRLLGEVADELAVIVETCGSATEAMPEMIRILLARLGGNNAGVRLLERDNKRFKLHARKRLRARTAEIRGSLAALLRRGIVQGEFRDIDPDLTALVLIGSLRMIAGSIARRQSAAAAQAIVAILIGGIGSHSDKTSAPPLQAVAQIDALGVG